MGWEWRYFVPSAELAGAEALNGCREDVYFAATTGAGLKLRDGAGELEVKLRTDTVAIAGRGEAEKWKKRHHRGCVSSSGGLDTLDVEACVAETGLSAADLFGQGGAPLARVLCRKDRVHTRHGERTDCLLLGFVGAAAAPALVERWTSVSVEIGDPQALARVVQQTELPDGAVVCGYPGHLAAFARRTLAAAGAEAESDAA
eukprot:SAG22_NODE_4063_length_1401_cov_1.186636_1_plen_201_part_01